MNDKTKFIKLRPLDQEKLKELKSVTGLKHDSEMIRYSIHNTWRVVCNESK